MNGVKQESFVHRGHRVTVAHWTHGGKFFVRAEIRHQTALVCVLSRSGAEERASKLLAGVHNAAIKWADHQASMSKPPG